MIDILRETLARFIAIMIVLLIVSGLLGLVLVGIVFLCEGCFFEALVCGCALIYTLIFLSVVFDIW